MGGVRGKIGTVKKMSTGLVSDSRDRKTRSGLNKENPAASKEYKKRKDTSAKHHNSKVAINHKNQNSSDDHEENESSLVGNKILPKVPKKDIKSSQDKKSDLAIDKNSKPKTEKSQKPITETKHDIKKKIEHNKDTTRDISKQPDEGERKKRKEK